MSTEIPAGDPSKEGAIEATVSVPAPAEHSGMGLPRQVRHELRSNIGQVIGYSELWLDDIETAGEVGSLDDLRRDLGRLHAAGRRILDLVNEHIDPISPHSRGEDRS